MCSISARAEFPTGRLIQPREMVAGAVWGPPAGAARRGSRTVTRRAGYAGWSGWGAYARDRIALDAKAPLFIMVESTRMGFGVIPGARHAAENRKEQPHAASTPA